MTKGSEASTIDRVKLIGAFHGEPNAHPTTAISSSMIAFARRQSRTPSE